MSYNLKILFFFMYLHCISIYASAQEYEVSFRLYYIERPPIPDTTLSPDTLTVRVINDTIIRHRFMDYDRRVIEGILVSIDTFVILSEIQIDSFGKAINHELSLTSQYLPIKVKSKNEVFVDSLLVTIAVGDFEYLSCKIHRTYFFHPVLGFLGYKDHLPDLNQCWEMDHNAYLGQIILYLNCEKQSINYLNEFATKIKITHD